MRTKSNYNKNSWKHYDKNIRCLTNNLKIVISWIWPIRFPKESIVKEIHCQFKISKMSKIYLAPSKKVLKPTIYKLNSRKSIWKTLFSKNSKKNSLKCCLSTLDRNKQAKFMTKNLIRSLKSKKFPSNLPIIFNNWLLDQILSRNNLKYCQG